MSMLCRSGDAKEKINGVILCKSTDNWSEEDFCFSERERSGVGYR